MIGVALSLALASMAAEPCPSNTATVTGKVTYTLNGKPITRPEKDVQTVVYVKRVSRISVPTVLQRQELEQRGTQFGRPLTIVVDPTEVSFPNRSRTEVHNVVLRKDEVQRANFDATPSEAAPTYLFGKDPGPTQVTCNRHSWMWAWILTLQNPWYAQPEPATGEYRIENIPVKPGAQPDIVAWHTYDGMVSKKVTVVTCAETRVDFVLEVGTRPRFMGSGKSSGYPSK